MGLLFLLLHNFLLLFLVLPVRAFTITPPARTTTPRHAVKRSRGELSCQVSKVAKLRELLASGKILKMPCCYDGLTARLVEMHGFPLTFMTGFGVSGARGHPDTQLVSYGEMLDSARQITEALRTIPCIGDGDTGYGNAVNVRRTVMGYAQAGLAGIMIEDQVAPKKCGHTKGKSTVSREEAYARIQAAVDARKDMGSDIIILARTDARAGLGVDEAIERCKKFVEIGADITFFEAPLSVEEMERYCREAHHVMISGLLLSVVIGCLQVPGPKLANMIQNGKTPVLPPSQLEKMGYTIAAYPLALLSSSIKAMRQTLDLLDKEEDFDHLLSSFDEVKTVVGFEEYYKFEDAYKAQ